MCGQVACQALGPPAKHGAVIGVDIQVSTTSSLTFQSTAAQPLTSSPDTWIVEVDVDNNVDVEGPNVSQSGTTIVCVPIIPDPSFIGMATGVGAMDKFLKVLKVFANLLLMTSLYIFSSLCRFEYRKHIEYRTCVNIVCACVRISKDVIVLSNGVIQNCSSYYDEVGGRS